MLDIEVAGAVAPGRMTEANQFKFGNNHELQKTNILLVRKFRRDVTEAGIELPGG